MIFETISPEKAKKLTQEGGVLVDVRTKEEFEAGHIEGSINIPHTEILTRAKTLLKDKNKPVILYCNAAKRSKQAWDLLNYSGYKSLYVIDSTLINKTLAIKGDNYVR